METKNYDEIAIEGSLWEILKNYCGIEKREQIVNNYRRFFNYKLHEIFDELNRTKHVHVSKDKTSLKHNIIDEEIKKLKSNGEYEKMLEREDIIEGKKTQFKDEAKIPWSKLLSDDYKVYYHRWSWRNVASIYKINDYRKIKNDKKEHRNKNKNIYIQWVANFFVYQKLPLRIFNLDDHEIEHINQYEDYVYSLKFNKDANKTFEENYIKRFEGVIKSTRQKIYVYDYTDQYPRKENVLEPYYKAHKYLYEKIEEQLKSNNQLQYTRIIALPFGEHLNKGDSVRDLYAKFLECCSVVLFEHITRVLKENLIHETIESVSVPEYLNIEEEDKVVINTGFYLINKPSRIYQFALIDDIVVSEMYRYHITGKCYPDVLFIEQVHDKHPHYIITMKEFLSLFKETKVIGQNFMPFDKIDLLYKIDSEVFNDFGDILDELIERNSRDDTKKDTVSALKNKKSIYNKYKITI